MLSMLFECFLFAIAGLGLEVIETAILDYPKAKNNMLMGHSSVWYLPFYAVGPCAFFRWIGPSVLNWPVIARGPIYVVVFWTVEFCAMGLLHLLLGKSPSEESYRRSKWNVNGWIRLDLWPVWLCFGLVFEWMFRRLHGL